MKAQEIDKIARLESCHWWFLGRRYLLRYICGFLVEEGRLVLDAGCGTGLAASELGHPSQVVGLDVSEAAFQATNWQVLGMPCIGSVERLPFRNESFDVVAALDVLEHLEEPEKALRELYRVAKVGAKLLVTVPAYRWLWSIHDEALGHKRRYTASSLRAALEASGFRIHRLSYTVTFLFPLAVLVRLSRRYLIKGNRDSDLCPLPSFLNALLAFFMRVEVSMLRFMDMPFGLTVFAIAEKANEVVTQPNVGAA